MESKWLVNKEERTTSSKLLDLEANHSKSQMSSCHIMKKLKSRFTKAWLSFLKLPLPLDIYKEVLATLHHNVIPYLSNPAILCDFLTRSYDIGGVISVMALSGLFILMTRHGLEYPRFYEKLYALLKPSIFMAKHRAVFFQLLDSCLKSSYLPAYLAAAYAKKTESIGSQVGDVVNGDSSVEVDESTENSKGSSLWEIDTLRHHYCPAVSRFVASLENDLTSRAKTTEMSISDFSSGSYATIFGDEDDLKLGNPRNPNLSHSASLPSRLHRGQGDDLAVLILFKSRRHTGKGELG
ncbi:hypothetical protein HPP92_025664 [Vanilla planifolia]|uniref:CCAAT-binding factor domain-containing protein n=1 Tax=Vanilla planifolia TaxID=51239 RepID=A0A835PIF4_VANPL|nr:hypothetical protein HPP92_025664 [Vanilla planifolia]